MQEHPNLMVEAVKAVKARIKDKNERVQIIALVNVFLVCS